MTIVAVLAVIQGMAGILGGFIFLQLASTFHQSGGGLSPLIVMLAEVKGWLWVALSAMYFIFAAAAWRRKSWAWGMGLSVSVLTVLYAVSALAKGGSVVVTSVWLIVPATIMAYLLSSAGRQAVGPVAEGCGGKEAVQ